MRDLERERAADALAKVKALVGGPELKALYRSYVDRFGGAVVMNGLGQALATELAAAGTSLANDREKAHKALADNVRDWLRKAPGGYPDREAGDDIMEAITSSDQPRYLRAQTETLAWLAWHKKFCHALLPKEEVTDGAPALQAP